MNKPRGAVRIQPKPAAQATPSQARRGAEQHKVALKDHSENWLRHHKRVARESLIRLLRTPMTTFMTVAVLAIALALPGFMFSALANLQGLTSGWESEARISLYLEPQLSDEQADRFSRSLLLRDDVAAIELISRQQGMLEFKRYSGFGDLLDLLGENPLPPVVMLIPRNRNTQALGLLQAQLNDLPEVDEAVLDMAWLQRLDAILEVARRAVVVLGILLACAVLLVVGNTIRLTIESRRDEIVVSKLVGATDAWVRRPFLYTGLWYGCFGAVFAWLVIQIAWMMLETPATALAQLYLAAPQLEGLGMVGALVLLITSLVLGLLGAWLAVRRHLRDIEPR